MTFSEPAFIGKRIEVAREKGKLTITVQQKIARWQEAFLLAWLSAWTFCGLVFVSYFLKAADNSEKFFFGVSTALWFFFWWRIGKVVLWRWYGKEIITIVPGELHIRNAIGKSGRNRVYQSRNIFKLGPLKRDITSFLAFMDQSFWVMGGDRIGFSYSGSKVQFGKQLTPDDAVRLSRTIDHALKEISKQ
ncbi:MAG: hypothetical protein RL220_1707 [Bacteroidota bacterium]|jgi:hypothetical protein